MWQQNADAASTLPEIKQEETGPKATFPPRPNIIIKHLVILSGISTSYIQNEHKHSWWKYTPSTFNAMKLLNKYSEMYAQCNRSLSDESRLTLGPLQGSCCGQANSRNADWYPKGSGLRISLSASLFFFVHPKQSRALGMALKQQDSLKLAQSPIQRFLHGSTGALPPSLQTHVGVFCRPRRCKIQSKQPGDGDGGPALDWFGWQSARWPTFHHRLFRSCAPST